MDRPGPARQFEPLGVLSNFNGQIPARMRAARGMYIPNPVRPQHPDPESPAATYQGDITRGEAAAAAWTEFLIPIGPALQPVLSAVRLDHMGRGATAYSHPLPWLDDWSALNGIRASPHRDPPIWTRMDPTNTLYAVPTVDSGAGDPAGANRGRMPNKPQASPPPTPATTAPRCGSHFRGCPPAERRDRPAREPDLARAGRGDMSPSSAWSTASVHGSETTFGSTCSSTSACSCATSCSCGTQPSSPPRATRVVVSAASAAAAAPGKKPSSLPDDYSIRGGAAAEPTRCVVRLVVEGETVKHIYISQSVCPACSDRSTGAGAGGGGHGRIELASARTDASDEGLHLFLTLLHAPDPADVRLPPPDASGQRDCCRALAYLALADHQFAAPEPLRRVVRFWADRWAGALGLRRRRRELPGAAGDEGGGPAAQLARAPGGRLAPLLYAAGALRLPRLWALAGRAAVLHCPVDVDGAICAPRADAWGEPRRLFSLVPDRNMQSAARTYCNTLKDTRGHVLAKIIDAIYDTRESIRRLKRYTQRDALKSQIETAGLWPHHRAADYRSHPIVQESLADLTARLERAADVAGSRGEDAQLLELVADARSIVDAMELSLPEGRHP